MRDEALSVQERFLYALLCTHVDSNGCCRRSLKAIAIEAGVRRRAVQKWLLGLETRGLVCKLNEVGKMGVYQIIRHQRQRGEAQWKNLKTVVERKVRFSAFGKKGSEVHANKKKEPLFTETPTRVSEDTGTGVFQNDPEHDSLTRLLEQESGHAALPPDGGGAPTEEKKGSGLQGEEQNCWREAFAIPAASFEGRADLTHFLIADCLRMAGFEEGQLWKLLMSDLKVELVP